MLSTADRHQQLDHLLDSAIADFDIPGEVYEQIVRRYEDVGAVLASYWPETTSGGVIYPQGSIRLGTVVRPIDARGEYDIDLVCRRELAKESTTQLALKTDVGKALSRYVARPADGNPTLNEGKRCWTLEYPLEPF